MHGFACVFLPHFLQTAPFPARSERVSATALKPPRKAGGRGGESTAARNEIICNYLLSLQSSKVLVRNHLISVC
ncbi:hypothetical protein E7V35_19575 [Escherichia coli]|nr:hypothetical protein [Escherichia coli]